MICDLHCHTKLSDGSMGIDDIIVLAEKCGVTTLAVTDLDCLAGTVRARLIGERHGIKVIQGVEISAYDSENDREVFILGYMSDSPDRLEGLCHRNLVARKRAAQFMMIKAAQRFPITTDLVLKCAQGSTNVYPVHIMAALVESGVTTELFGDLYKELFSKGGDKSILIKPKFSEMAEVIQAVHDAGGIAIMKVQILLRKQWKQELTVLRLGVPSMTRQHRKSSLRLQRKTVFLQSEAAASAADTTDPA